MGVNRMAGAFGINCRSDHRPLTLQLINGGYDTAQYTLYGLMRGWH